MTDSMPTANGFSRTSLNFNSDSQALQGVQGGAERNTA